MKILYIFIILISTTTLQANEVISLKQATCRVLSNTGCGTGVCIQAHGEGIIVMTNYHVVGRDKWPRLEFEKLGFSTYGKVYWYRYYGSTSADIALIHVSKKRLKGHTVPIMTIAKPDLIIKKNDRFLSYGYPNCGRLELIDGKILDSNNSLVTFTPPPLGGRSGSGICIKKNDKIYVIGLLAWSFNDDSYGGGLSHHRIHSLFRGEQVIDKLPKGSKEL